MAAEPTDGDLKPEDWGRHLRADYRHDGLEPLNVPYNIGRNRPEAKQQVPPRFPEFDEDAFMEYALNQGYVTRVPAFKARMASRLEFKLPSKNAEFDGSAPKIFDAGNAAIGLVMDAGKNVTEYLGVQNVISFGMCIDPAGSSIAQNQRPVFYDPANKKVYIQLRQFGFDPDVIQGVWIVNVMGGSLVQSVWMMGPQWQNQRIDPVKRKKYGPPPAGVPLHTEAALGGIPLAELGLKPINVTDPEKAGYYTSINNATDAGGAGSDFYKMGKTLGDTMIVASAMPKFKLYDSAGNLVAFRDAAGNTTYDYPNPYYGVGKAVGTGDAQKDVWKNHFNVNNSYPYTPPPEGNPPQTFLVKTGDRLNAVRAIFKGVPVILERQAKGNAPKFFEYFPGTPAPEQIVAAIEPGYDRIIADCRQRYTTLIANMNALLERAGGPLKTEAARFSGEKRAQRFNLDAAQLGQAGAFVSAAITGIEALQAASLTYLNTVKDATVAAIRGLPADITVESIAPIRDTYSLHTQQMLAISPQSTTVSENYLTKPVVVVTFVDEVGIDIGGGQRIKTAEIHLLAAVSAIAEGNPIVEGIKRQFLDNVPVVAAAAPAAPEVAVGTLAFIKTALVGWVTGLFAQFQLAGQVGGAIEDELNWGTNSGHGLPADLAATVVAFVEYLRAIGYAADPLQGLKAIYGLLRMRELAEYTDASVVDTLRRELLLLKYMNVVDFPTAPEPDYGGPDAAAPQIIVADQPILPACFLVSAYVANMNQINVSEFNASAELREVFATIEAAFLAGFRPRAPAAPPAAEMATGEFGAAGAPGGEPAVYPEVLLPKPSTTGLGPKALASRDVAEKRKERAYTALKSARETARARRAADTRTGFAESLGIRLRAGRRRTFRQKRAKKDKDAAGTA